MSANTSRRQMLGAPAALLLLASPSAGAAKAAELDGALLKACAAFQRAHTALDVMNIGPGLPDTESLQISGEWWDTLRDVIAAPTPRTLEGQQAKVEAAYIALREHVCAQAWQIEPWREQAGPAETLALECLAAIAGRAKA